ncbi:SPT3 Dosage dependent suppressor of Ty-induced promoter mutations-like protein [Coemansia sp. RSA 1250]|nr:SPT3 Dosage dependent suppressor of Ty-induced promoter mutations-like protein [Coemansia sp. RSA 1250]
MIGMSASENTLREYLKNEKQQGAMNPELSNFLLAANTKSTPGSPTPFSGTLGFNSVRTSPSLEASAMSRHSFTNLAALSQGLVDTATNSAVQSATASPTGALGRRNLLSGMANLNMTQLSQAQEVDHSLVDTSAMFGNGTSAYAHQPESTMSGYPAMGQGTANAPSAEFLQQVERVKAKGLQMTLEGIPSENAKSRVETQIKAKLVLTTMDGERVNCWSHLQLPELLVARDKYRHRLQSRQQQQQALVDGSLPSSPYHAVRLEATIKCSSDPTRPVETCHGCINREYKRSLRRKDTRGRGIYSTCTTPGQSRAPSPTHPAPSTMEADWDEARIALEKKRIVIFNCSDMMDFSKGEASLPTRITCYCRHHMEKTGFCIYLSLYDCNNQLLATHVTPPIMITDDHKSKFKSDRTKTRAKHEYDRMGTSGSAAYANHALSGMNSPTGHFSAGALADTSGLVMRGPGNRQAMSARNSPNLRPHPGYYNNPPTFLDTYSQFASLAGTPSLNNTPLQSPMLSAAAAAAHLSGFESPFHLPPQQSQHQQSAMGLGNYTASASQTMLPMSPLYGTMQQSQQSGNALGLQTSFGDPTGIMSQLGSPVMASEPVQIGQLLPKQGPVAGGIRVMITGRGFHNNMEVYFGDMRAGHTRVDSSTAITCMLPVSKTSGPVTLRILDTATRTMHDASSAVFVYEEDTDQALLEFALHIIGFKSLSEAEQGFSAIQKRSEPEVEKTLRSLLAAGSERNLVQIEQLIMTILQQMLSCGLLGVQSLSLKHEASNRTILHFAAFLGMWGLVSTVLPHMSAVDEVDNNDMTAMHFACIAGRADILELLLSVGALSSLRSSTGMTPADYARSLGHTTCLVLIEGSDTYLNFIEDDQAAGSNLQQASNTMTTSAVSAVAAMGLPWNNNGQNTSGNTSFSLAAAAAAMSSHPAASHAYVSMAPAVPATMLAQHSNMGETSNEQLLGSNALFSPLPQQQQPYYPPN